MHLEWRTAIEGTVEVVIGYTRAMEDVSLAGGWNLEDLE